MSGIEKKIPVVVTEDMADENGNFTYMMRCYRIGETIQMRPFDYAAKTNVEVPVIQDGQCWPEYCSINGFFPLLKNRLQRNIPAGETRKIEIPSRACGKPNRVYFNWCGDCFAVDLDKEPAEGDVDDLQAPIQNPQRLWIGKNPEDGTIPEVIFVTNKSETELCLSLSFFC